jgi:hypothetical protein
MKNTRNRLLATASALALIVGTAACDSRVNENEDTVRNLDANADAVDSRSANQAQDERTR